MKVHLGRKFHHNIIGLRSSNRIGTWMCNLPRWVNWAPKLESYFNWSNATRKFPNDQLYGFIVNANRCITDSLTILKSYTFALMSQVMRWNAADSPVIRWSDPKASFSVKTMISKHSNNGWVIKWLSKFRFHRESEKFTKHCIKYKVFYHLTSSCNLEEMPDGKV